ncbi:unnamed protein product, partial [Polarella glacialis]
MRAAQAVDTEPPPQRRILGRDGLLLVLCAAFLVGCFGPLKTEGSQQIAVTLGILALCWLLWPLYAGSHKSEHIIRTDSVPPSPVSDAATSGSEWTLPGAGDNTQSVTPLIVSPFSRSRCPQPSARAQRASEEVLEYLASSSREGKSSSRSFAFGGVRGPAPPPIELQKAASKWRLTMLDLEALVVPSWVLDSKFATREEWQSYVGADKVSEDHYLEEIQGLERRFVNAKPPVRSARWVQLLDGSVIARLMSDSRPTCVFSWASNSFINDILR